ncbi:RNA polymerase sigma factor [Verrucosispora sp. WMMD573]|uniref:RNA polymerase sigma factor n=1 Tax=Verrucosispora sp. WMMD573 TaxID=3015149 RepID=UPI00248BC140|nr:RNA polymerase sigma factor [Verrucosispora sp. WMMD573]WBB52323.1 RNA polymerase sigma factor [Verrucosispora sp. WMMD573]
MTGVEGTAALTPEPADREAMRKAEAARRKAEDDQQFAAFYEASYHQAERALSARCRDRGLVEDALNEAYHVGRIKWSMLREHVKPAAWVIKTARFKIMKAEQRQRRENAVAPEELPPSAPHPDVADVWEAQETLRTWLRQLPPRHAEVFQMDHDGFSIQDIARILGLTESSVRCYKAAAKKRLRELAEEAGYTDSEGPRRKGDSRGSR